VVVGCGSDPDMVFAKPTSFQPTGDMVKYLYLVFSITRNDVILDPYGELVSNTSKQLGGSCTVDPLSGVRTGGCSGDALQDVTAGMPGAPVLNGLLFNSAGLSVKTWLDLFAGYRLPKASDRTRTTTISADGHSASGVQTYAHPDLGEITIESWSVSATHGNFSGFNRQPFPQEHGHGAGEILENLTVSDTSWSYTYSEHYDPLLPTFEDPGDQGRTTEITISANLSLQNTYADVLADMYSLAGTWNLADDKQYPWRVDDIYGAYGTAPLVTRNEVPEPMSPEMVGTDVPSWTDPNAELYSSEILGSPQAVGNPYAFDFRFVQWQYCEPYGETLGYWYESWYGLWNNHTTGLPKTATQWTNVPDSAKVPQGWWVMERV
jgi:hypothetical protein